MISKNAVAGLLASGLLLLMAGACSDGIDLSQEETDAGIIGGIQTNLTDPVAVIEAFDRAWNERNYAAYQALLDEDFDFVPLEEDGDDFPWLEGDSWDLSTELGMAFNMFDPNYSQGNGAVDVIELSSTPVNIQTLEDGTIRVLCSTIGRVMWTASDGASFDTRLQFDLVWREGFLRIRRIEEIPRTLGRDQNESTWGSVKGLYR